jgi:hypothetical protein
MYYEMFPEEIIELQAEIQQHEPLLTQLLQLPKDSPMEMKLGEVASYCGVILDGYYNSEDILKICIVLINKLKRKRGELVLEIVQSLPPQVH